MSWENHLKILENKLSGKLIPWMIMSVEKCLTGGKNGRIEYLEEKIREINEAQPACVNPNECICTTPNLNDPKELCQNPKINPEINIIIEPITEPSITLKPCDPTKYNCNV